MRPAQFLVCLEFMAILLFHDRGLAEALNNVEDADECIEYEKVGCFWDFLVKPRPLPLLVENYRSTFDWNDPRETIKREVSNCARKISQRGYTYFGLQFYGECWSGENATKTFDRDGSTDRCLMVVNNKDYEKCDDGRDELCAGVEFSNYVYRIIHAVDGMFSAWSGWSQCSASCEEGQRKRTRSCNNPSPSKCGKKCIGNTEEVVPCNTQPCSPPEPCEDTNSDCKLYKDLGLCNNPDVIKNCRKSCEECS